MQTMSELREEGWWLSSPELGKMVGEGSYILNRMLKECLGVYMRLRELEIMILLHG